MVREAGVSDLDNRLLRIHMWSGALVTIGVAQKMKGVNSQCFCQLLISRGPTRRNSLTWRESWK